MNPSAFPKWVAPVAATFFVFAGCASSSTVAPPAPLPAATNRAPAAAAAAARFGLECIAQSGLFRDFKGEGAEIDSDDAELNRFFSPLKGEERSRALALALAGSYAYGQQLLEQYESHLDRRETLEQIMRNSSVYAELQALFFLRHDLERIAGSAIASAVVNGMGNAPRGTRAAGIRLIEQTTNAQITRWKNFIAERLEDPGYETLALDEAENAIADLEASARKCDEVETPATPKRDLPVKVIAAARALPKKPLAYRAFEPKRGESGLEISKLIRRRGGRIQKQWSALVERTPQGSTTGAVIAPSPGKNGNIFGNHFPKGVWALTFDDGPHGGNQTEPSYTREVLANLKQHEMKATFFVLSRQLERKDCVGIGSRTVSVKGKDGLVSEHGYDITSARPTVVFPELAVLEREEGHAVESHSYYHSQVPKDDDAEQDCEIRQAMDVFTEKMGARPAFFRLPYGAGFNDPKIRTKIAEAGAVHVYWNIDTLDWQNHDPDSIVRLALKAMKTADHGVILFHDVHPQSVIASERIMAYLKDPANHIETVTIPEIVDRLNGKAAAPGQFGAH